MGLLIFTLQIINFLAWPVLALGYPLWASIRAIETGSKSHMRRLVTYWTIFSFISLFEHVFEKLIQWVPLWQYIKLITICWLVIPQFDGACYFYENLIHPCLLVNLRDVITQFYCSCYVYQRLLYLCLSVYLQTVSDWFNKPMDDPSFKNEIFLAMAERYLQENGSDALEKLIANKIKDHSVNIPAEEIKTTDTSDEAGMLTTNQTASEGGGPVMEGIKAMEHMAKPEIAEPKQVKTVKEDLNCIDKKTTLLHVKEMAVPTEKSNQLKQEEVKHETAALSEHSTYEKLKEVVHLAAQQEKPMQQKNADVSVQNSTLWCGTCNLWCPGDILMAAHINGREHLAKLQTTMSSTAVAERYLEENRTDALEKLNANKSKDYCLNHHPEEIKTSEASDTAGMLTPSQVPQLLFPAPCTIDSEESGGGPVREDINAMRHMAKHEAVGAKQVRRVKENLIWVEKKTTGVQVKDTALPADLTKSGTNEESKEKVQLGANGEHEKQKQMKNAGGAAHNSELWCCFCNVRGSSEIDMAAHLNGRKHWAKLQETTSSTTLALDYANRQFY